MNGPLHPTQGPLPPLVLYDGDLAKWGDYVESLYEIFVRDFSGLGVQFFGHPVTAPRMPETMGKHASFWHVISTGKSAESDRIPDLRRCERIGWIAWVIRRAGQMPEIMWWDNERVTRRGRERHFVIAFEPERFVVVLAWRRGAEGQGPYFVLKSAYVVEHENRWADLVRERDSCLRRGQPDPTHWAAR